MEYRHLGTSGLLVSEIAYGNWAPPGTHIDQEMASACIHAALEAGITTFDTADGYNDALAETQLSIALRGVRRESVEICTKAYFPTGPGPNERGLSRKHLRDAIDGSLRRLGTDYVDVYQAHRYDYQTPLHETMEAFAAIVHAGKALYIGVSEWKPDQIRAAAALARELHVDVVCNQAQYSMFWRVIEDEVQPACQAVGITQLAYSPLAQGILTGKYVSGQQMPRRSRAADSARASAGPVAAWASPEAIAQAHQAGRGSISDWMTPAILTAVGELASLAAQAGMTLPEMALAWVLANQNVSTAITGGSRPEQIRQNARASGLRLDGDLLARIDQVTGPVAERDPQRLPVYLTRP